MLNFRILLEVVTDDEILKIINNIVNSEEAKVLQLKEYLEKIFEESLNKLGGLSNLTIFEKEAILDCLNKISVYNLRRFDYFWPKVKELSHSRDTDKILKNIFLFLGLLSDYYRIDWPVIPYHIYKKLIENTVVRSFLQSIKKDIEISNELIINGNPDGFNIIKFIIGSFDVLPTKVKEYISRDCHKNIAVSKPDDKFNINFKSVDIIAKDSEEIRDYIKRTISKFVIDNFSKIVIYHNITFSMHKNYDLTVSFENYDNSDVDWRPTEGIPEDYYSL